MEMSMALVKSIVFTTGEMDSRMIEVLEEVRNTLDIRGCTVLYQSHEESFYYYMLYQPQELWNRDVVAVDYSYGSLNIYTMQMNRNMTPVVVTVDRSTTDDYVMENSELPGDSEAVAKLDEQLRFELEKVMDKRYVSAVYLLGNAFRTRWMDSTLKYLCSGRRVFQGNNLFSKGASIAARERMNPGESAGRYVFLQDDKIRYNVGMRLKKAGTPAYHALLDAGTSWFDASAGLCVIPEDEKELSFEITPVTGGKAFEIRFELTGLPDRQPRMTRLSLRLGMVSVNVLKITAVDQGFGEFEASTGLTWTREYDLDNI
jgi:hypothetical protein